MQSLQNTRVKKTSAGHTTVVRGGDVAIGQDSFTVIAGTCALESIEQAVTTAKGVESAGAKVFRGSLFKPRAWPYSFQGGGRGGMVGVNAVEDGDTPVRRRGSLPTHEKSCVKPGMFEQMAPLTQHVWHACSDRRAGAATASSSVAPNRAL